MTWFEVLAADFCDSGIQKLVPRFNKYLDNAVDFIEKKLCTGNSFHIVTFVN
jgi:hypothetical protein